MKLKKEEMASMCYIYLLAHGFHNVANISYEKKKKIPIGIDILYQIFMNFYGYLSVKLPLQVENCSFFTYFFFFFCVGLFLPLVFFFLRVGLYLDGYNLYFLQFKVHIYLI